VENKFTSITEDPEAPLGFDQFNTYVSAAGIHARHGHGGQYLYLEQINFDVKAMRELVHKRKPSLKAGFFEKIDGEVCLPGCQGHPDIEKNFGNGTLTAQTRLKP
jgi:hypothetical protein